MTALYLRRFAAARWAPGGCQQGASCVSSGGFEHRSLSIVSPRSFSSVPPQASATRWLGIAFVLAVHGLAVWALMAHRLLPMPAEAVTLMVNFIAPPAPQQAAPKPAQKPPEPKRPEPKPKPIPKKVPKQLPTQPSRQLVAEAPVFSPAEPVAASAPPAPPPLEVAPPAPAMPLSAGPVALGGELSVVCPARRPPAYPALSRRLGETGKVVLRVTLDESGRVAKATVDRSSGFARLDEAALAAVRNWRCTPALRNGRPVEATAVQPFNFVLEGN